MKIRIKQYNVISGTQHQCHKYYAYMNSQLHVIRNFLTFPQLFFIIVDTFNSCICTLRRIMLTMHY